MEPETFVALLRDVVVRSAFEDVVSQLRVPAGRRPTSDILERSVWFNGLARDDQDRVQEVAEEAAKAALFGLLCVLDGVRAIEDGRAAGSLELHHIVEGKKILLGSSELGKGVPPLHELL
jgi:hypothetical protein